jgi:NurA domain
MGYAQFKGRKPFERASKIAHSEILNNPDVQAFVEGCTIPSEPEGGELEHLQKPLPKATPRIETVIAVDGGMTEAAVRREFPSASITFMTFGPLLLDLKDLGALDNQPFIGPEDMARLKNLSRFSLSVPTKSVRAKGASRFSEGVRRTIQEFLFEKQKELGTALQWLLFRGWLPRNQMEIWEVPKCPSTPNCTGRAFRFEQGGPTEIACAGCGQAVFLSDALRLYERIDDEQGAGGIMSYLLTTLEQLVIVNIVRTLLSLKQSTLREVLLIKDGPLAFFGTAAPLHKPASELMTFLSDKDSGRPLVCLIGLEKSGAFVEHAMLIEPRLKPGHYLQFTNHYIYRYILPGDPAGEPYGHNTYYGTKLAFKSSRGDVFVATMPLINPAVRDGFENIQNGAEVLNVVSQLRCSMYDQALVPIVLANKLVSLADFPSSEILAKFVRSKVSSG